VISLPLCLTVGRDRTVVSPFLPNVRVTQTETEFATNNLRHRSIHYTKIRRKLIIRIYLRTWAVEEVSDSSSVNSQIRFSEKDSSSYNSQLLFRVQIDASV
jgi:hypothetical protein